MSIVAQWLGILRGSSHVMSKDVDGVIAAMCVVLLEAE
jgi:hypothetical protein